MLYLFTQRISYLFLQTPEQTCSDTLFCDNGKDQSISLTSNVEIQSVESGVKVNFGEHHALTPYVNVAHFPSPLDMSYAFSLRRKLRKHIYQACIGVCYAQTQDYVEAYKPNLCPSWANSQQDLRKIWPILSLHINMKNTQKHDASLGFRS